MKHKSESTTALKTCFQDCGVPHTLLSDNAKELKSKEVISYLIKMILERKYTEPHHPNQNLAERRDGTIKSIVVYLLQITGAPLDYWCFAVEYVVMVRNVIARRENNWRTPYE